MIRQQVVVDNRAGAGGLIGTDIVAKAAPDGYTVLITAVPHVVNPSLFKNVPYDTRKDFAPVIKLMTYSNILIANRTLSASSVPELIQLAKRMPGTINYGSGLHGSLGEKQTNDALCTFSTSHDHNYGIFLFVPYSQEFVLNPFGKFFISHLLRHRSYVWEESLKVDRR
jgi:hypothetical protein